MTSGSDPTYPSASSPNGRETLVDRLVAGYADSPAARGIVAMAVGMLGSIFGPAAGVAAAGDAALSAWASHIQGRRAKRFQAEAADQIARLDGFKLDREFVNSEAGLSWLIATLDQIVRTQEDERFDAVRNVFVNGVTVDASGRPFKEIALDLAGRLTPVHLQVLKLIHTVRSGVEPLKGRWDVNIGYLHQQLPGVLERDIRAVCFHLVSLGLIESPETDQWNRFALGTGPDSYRFTITELGRLLL